jgi:RNA polymerase sigma factor (sigma-70 family)
MRAALFERVLTRIHRYFTRCVWDPQGVEDCVQETLLRLERSLQEGTYDPQRSFNRWMWLKAHSVFVDHCRKRGKLPGALSDGEAPSATSPDPDARLDAEAVLSRLRGDLEPEAFEMFVLFFGEGQTVTEVAAVTGRDRKTVRKRLDDAKRRAVGLLG